MDIAQRARDKKLLPGRGPGRDVHDHEPRRLRHVPRDAGHQPAAGRDPRDLRGRQAAVGRPGRDGPGRDRDPPDHEPDADLRPPPRRRRATRGCSSATSASSSRAGTRPRTERARRHRCANSVARDLKVPLAAQRAAQAARLPCGARFEVGSSSASACHCESCKKLSRRRRHGERPGPERRDPDPRGRRPRAHVPAVRGLVEDVLLGLRLEPLRRRLAGLGAVRASG